MHPRLERLYATKRPPKVYRQQVQGMVRVLQARYGLQKRESEGGSPGEPPEAASPEQIGFRW